MKRGDLVFCLKVCKCIWPGFCISLPAAPVEQQGCLLRSPAQDLTRVEGLKGGCGLIRVRKMTEIPQHTGNGLSKNPIGLSAERGTLEQAPLSLIPK